MLAEEITMAVKHIKHTNIAPVTDNITNKDDTPHKPHPTILLRELIKRIKNKIQLESAEIFGLVPVRDTSTQ